MKPLHELVLNEVKRRGRVTFKEFMQWALFHPQYGYYMTGPLKTGRQGDFFTSAHVGGLFGKLLTETFCEMWDHHGSGKFTLVELGAGDGGLAEQVLQAFQAKDRHAGLTYCLVETSPFALNLARRRLSRFPRVKFFDSLDALEHVSGVEGCVFSNEFFDALPFHRVLWDNGTLRELFVRESGGRLLEEPGDPSTPKLAAYFRERGVSLVEGQKAEVCLALDETMAELDRILSRGFILSVDYGEPSPDLYRETRTEGTLQVYRKHERRDGPFEDIGECDLTALVDFGRIAALGEQRDIRPLIFASQGTFLLNSGEQILRGLVEGAPEAERIAAASQVQQLIHPNAMGGRFHVLVQGKNVGTPELSGGRLNRIQRLKTPSLPA